MSDTTIAELKRIFGDGIVELPHNEIIILSMAATEEEISNASLQNAIDLHPSDLSKLLRKMCNDGMLIASGFGRGTTYRLNRGNVAGFNLASSDVASSDVASSDVASSDVASSKKIPTHSDDDNVITMIREASRHQWLSSRDISLRIGRHPTHVRRIIKKMLENGSLKQEFPNQPTHPAQRYHTV